ncbi:tripartite tricarboxylate transporter substrate binding protein [Variovorax ureilyticus]|uniref:Tripartite tricarboxylate transporter substrate binding protein n=1 Tax=Variovorax ureilyticus TaxID=1836198 RepID=A0ABU8VPU6_9BURK
MKSILLFILAMGSLLTSHAQDNYPSRPIRIIVPYGAGNATDNYARMLGQKLSEALKQPVVIENRPGAAAIVGTQAVVQAPADGYTLLFTSSGHVIAPVARKKPPYDPIKDFAPIGLAVEYPYYLIGATSLPASNVQELIAYGRAHPGKLNYGTLGEGSGGHLLGQIFEQKTGVKATHVPYKTTSGFLTGLQSGEVDFAFDSVGSAHPLVVSGKLRGFAVTGDKRVATAPEVPTLKEAGVDGFDAMVWLGLLAPAKTPQPIIAKLNNALVHALQSADMKARIERDGLRLAAGSPDQLAKRIQEDMIVWSAAAKRAGVALE